MLGEALGTLRNFFSKRHRVELSTLDLIQFRVFQLIWTLGAIGLLMLLAVLTCVGAVAQVKAVLWP